MNLTPHVNRLRESLERSAAAGGDEATRLADRLLPALDSAARLTLIEALSAACDEITVGIAPGSVEVRLRGGEIGFVVTPPPASDFEPEPAPMAPPTRHEGADESPARVNFRPPESLKARIEEAARAEGVSVNAWLTRVATTAVDPGCGGAKRSKSWFGDSFTGWVR